ncbi:MAG: phage portal protein [Sphingomonadaceae bacterium]|nr:phage portal protein [Sphingomonadaceae bacterium]
MKWFGRKSGGGSARPALTRGFGGLVQGDWPRGYESQVRSGYCENAVAQRAVRLVSEGAGAAPITVEPGEVGTGPTPNPSPEGEGDRIVALVTAPSAGQSLVETVAAQLLLHGNAFVQVLLDAKGEPGELFALRPERVSIEADARGWPAAYVYRAGEAKTRVPARDGMGRPGLVHIKAMHPLDDHYGLGSLGAAAGAIAIHNAATRWNKALLDNAARPSGALSYDPGKDGGALSGEQFDRLREELEASFSGAANAGRPLLLEGGLRWQAMSLTPADMDFVGLKAAAAREIALAFGVPPMLLGLPGDATYANYREANRALWRLTILPLAEKILGGIARGLSAWRPGVGLRVDVDRVPAMSEDRERLWKQVGAADFLSDEEKRAMVGIA